LIKQINHHTQSQTTPDTPILWAWAKLKRILQTIVEHTDGTLHELDKDLRNDSWARATEQEQQHETKKDGEPEPDHP
jgi:hypothetical protein